MTTCGQQVTKQEVEAAGRLLRHGRLEVFNDGLAERVGAWLEANAEVLAAISVERPGLRGGGEAKAWNPLCERHTDIPSPHAPTTPPDVAASECVLHGWNTNPVGTSAFMLCNRDGCRACEPYRQGARPPPLP